MPAKGRPQRAEQAAAVASAIHDLASDPLSLGDLIAEASVAQGAEAVNVAEAARLHRRGGAGAAGAGGRSRAGGGAGAGGVDRGAGGERFAAFAPTLERIVALKRAEAECLANRGRQRLRRAARRLRAGMTAAELDAIFARLRPGLVDLAARIAAEGRPVPGLSGSFPRQRSSSWRGGSAPPSAMTGKRGGSTSPCIPRGPVRPGTCGSPRGWMPRTAGLPLFDAARDRACGLRAGARPGAGDAARRDARLDGGAREPVAALREPARAQPGVLRLFFGEMRRRSAAPEWRTRTRSGGW